MCSVSFTDETVAARHSLIIDGEKYFCLSNAYRRFSQSLLFALLLISSVLLIQGCISEKKNKNMKLFSGTSWWLWESIITREKKWNTQSSLWHKYKYYSIMTQTRVLQGSYFANPDPPVHTLLKTASDPFSDSSTNCIRIPTPDPHPKENQTDAIFLNESKTARGIGVL